MIVQLISILTPHHFYSQTELLSTTKSTTKKYIIYKEKKKCYSNTVAIYIYSNRANSLMERAEKEKRRDNYPISQSISKIYFPNFIVVKNMKFPKQLRKT